MVNNKKACILSILLEKKIARNGTDHTNQPGADGANKVSNTNWMVSTERKRS